MTISSKVSLGNPGGLTPSQTVGPFWSIGLAWEDGHEVVADDTPNAIWLRGRALDGSGDPIAGDGLVESWQADSRGRYAHPLDPSGGVTEPEGFTGLGRCKLDDEGRFALRTVKPGPTPGPDGELHAPHIALSLFARGMLNRAVTRCYFPDEEGANAGDPLLRRLDPEERATLIARTTEDGYAIDLQLQGENATVFFVV